MIGLPDHAFVWIGLWYFGFGKQWNTSKSMDDNGADSDLNCQELAQEVSENNFSMLLSNRFCDILVKDV